MRSPLSPFHQPFPTQLPTLTLFSGRAGDGPGHGGARAGKERDRWDVRERERDDGGLRGREARRAQLPGRSASSPLLTHRTGAARGVGRARAGQRRVGMVVVRERKKKREASETLRLGRVKSQPPLSSTLHVPAHTAPLPEPEHHLLLLGVPSVTRCCGCGRRGRRRFPILAAPPEGQPLGLLPLLLLPRRLCWRRRRGHSHHPLRLLLLLLLALRHQAGHNAPLLGQQGLDAH